MRFGYPIGNGANCGAIVPEVQVKSAVGQLTRTKNIGGASSFLTNNVQRAIRIQTDNYNEAGDLKEQIELYHNRFGFYPESVHADKIYRNRDNREFCKKRGIRLSGPVPGRPPKQIDSQHKIQARQDELDRIPIEGKFGQAKRRFSLSKIMCKNAALVYQRSCANWLKPQRQLLQ